MGGPATATGSAPRAARSSRSAGGSGGGAGGVSGRAKQRERSHQSVRQDAKAPSLFVHDYIFNPGSRTSEYVIICLNSSVRIILFKLLCK